MVNCVSWKFLYPKKPIILHYHGSRIRGKAKERRKYYQKADSIIVSTSDLLETLPDATYIPNPVDTELFKPMEKDENRFLISFVGSRFQKGVDLLQRIIPKVLSNARDIVFLLINGGFAYNYKKALCKRYPIRK